MHIDPRYLAQISAIVEAGTFQAAADALGLTQPALSRNIRLVEQRVGQPIFERIGRRAQPTDLGLKLAKEGLTIRQAQEIASVYLDSMKAGFAGRLRVGAPSGIALQLLSPTISLFVSDYPDVFVDLSVGTTDELSGKLESGQIDLVIGPLSMADRWHGLKTTKIFDDSLGIVCRKKHPLMEKKQISIKDLLNFGWVAHRNGSPLRLQTEEVLEAIGLRDVKFAIVSQTADCIYPLISYCDLLSTMPRWSHAGLTPAPVSFLNFDHPLFERPIGIIRRQNMELSPLLRSFIKRFQIFMHSHGR
ncbi:LysR family transcriptional regulator [Acidocella sp. KAb 2-4]|uniref:LysR family transcriptional regulator n=1 Tax=Acidocella sp. KAb 2-4 TaxID=2885158 RepID=UPI001D07A631|nr:LysR family transcriptional regulator [Acidocella sp. KAb 2-4]MCB5946033.1 LysR family transcriptional regulator [Acidocella sp. KAb 2-4]